MTPDFPYVALPGAFRGFFRKASLWEGPDHVLSITGTRFNEEYRRFYYRDIQALILEKTVRTGSYGWWITLLSLLPIAIIFAFSSGQSYSWVPLLLLSLVLIVRTEISFRRSCRCSIQTAVSREPLPSLMRRTAAQAAVARLQMRIAAEQGDLPPEIPPREEDVPNSVLPPDRTRPSAQSLLDAAAIKERRRSCQLGTNWAIAALFVLLINSVFTSWAAAAGRLISPKLDSAVSYSFVLIGLFPIFISLQHFGVIRAVKGLRILLVSLIVFNAVRLLSSALVPIVLATPVVLRQGSFFRAIFSRYYANTNGALQFAFAAGGLLLIFAKWDTYRRGGESSS
jgi:hypothetical protein